MSKGIFTRFQGRRAAQLENRLARVTLLVGGGHIAEITLQQKGVNALWRPPWPTIEPAAFDPGIHTAYGNNAESRLLAGIMGHNLCLDIFGPPSEEEARCGLTVHGEAPVVNWKISSPRGGQLQATAELPVARLRVNRRLALVSGQAVLNIVETVENLASVDRAVGWTQHVTLGPPFLAPGRTLLFASATRSKVIETDFTGGKGRQLTGAEFDWPWCPARDGGRIDRREMRDAPVSAGYTAHLMDRRKEQAWFAAYNQDVEVLFGYLWQRSDFPWLGIWEENRSREQPPWNGRTIALGLEFGVSPMPESRRGMIDRGSLFGVPTYRWIPARSQVRVHYSAFIRRAPGLRKTTVFDPCRWLASAGKWKAP